MGVKWTMNDLKAKNIHINMATNKGTQLPSFEPIKKKRIVNTSSTEKNFIEFVLMAEKIQYIKEHRFDEQRRFKFDFAILDKKIAIEYEGLVFKSNQEKGTGKSGHTTVTGFSSNCTKYNIATVQGWRILRYTTLNFKEFANDILIIINEQK